MTVLYSDNFDNDTTGQLPSGWANAVGTWQVGTANAISGKALASTANGPLDAAVYTGQSMTDGTVTVDYKVTVPNSAAQTNSSISTIFRTDATFQNGYLWNVDNQGGVQLFKRVGGGFSSIGAQIVSFPTTSVGDTLRTEARFVGSTLEYRAWNVTTGGARPSSPLLSITDATFANGFSGVLNNVQSSSSPAVAADNFAIADNSASSGTGTPTPTPTPSASSVMIGRNDPALYYSPGNWCDDGTSRMSANTGAYVKFSFTGTSLSLLTTALASMSAYPQVRAIIDGIAYNVGLSTATSFPIATGLASGTHICEIYLRSSLYSAGSWWNLANALKITGFQIDSGASVSAYSARPNVLYAFGDSLTQAYFLDGGSSPANDDALGNYVSPLAEALNAEYGQIGWGGQNFAGAGVSDVPALNTAYASVGSGYTRLNGGQFITQPAYITVMEGTNGNPAQADVATSISNMRAAAPNATIFYIVPGCGTGRTNITAAINAAISAGDAKLFLIDAGVRYQTGLFVAQGAVSGGTEAAPADGVHYGRRANARLGAEWVRQMQHYLEPHRFTVVGN